MLFKEVLQRKNCKKWSQHTYELEKIYKRDKQAFTNASQDIMMKIIEMRDAKNEQFKAFIKLYQVMSKQAEQGFTVSEPLFSDHIEKAFKMLQMIQPPQSEVGIKSFEWLEALIKEAP